MDMERRLNTLGYEVIEHVLSGEDAIAKAGQERPDIILMDIHLKGEMDGIEAAERIKASLGTPVIYITAYSDETTLARAKVTEPFGYILKPFQEREIYSTIEMALYKYHIEQELRSAKIEAEEGSRAKSEFLANVSHELRTPLNSILGMTQLARKTEDFKEQQDYLQIVEDSGRSLLNLIDSLLDFSRMEAGRVTLNNDDFFIDEVVENAVNKLWTQIQEKDLCVYIDIDEEIRFQMRGDEHKLDRIFLNLLSNAVKFTEFGWIYIHVTTEEDENAGEVLLHGQVRDTGCGIPESEQKYVFNAFHQVDSTSTRKYSGAGLGLSIVSDLVQLMGGAIDFSSREGQGTEFNFTVRLDPAQVEQPRDFDAVNFQNTVPLCYICTDTVLADIRARQFSAWKLKVVPHTPGHTTTETYTPEPGCLLMVEGSPNECSRIGTRLQHQGVPPQRMLFLVRGTRNKYLEQNESSYIYCPIYRRTLLSQLQKLLSSSLENIDWSEMPAAVALQGSLLAADDKIESELHELFPYLINFEKKDLYGELFSHIESRAQHMRKLAQHTDEAETSALLFKLIMAARAHDQPKIKKILSDLKNLT